MSHSGHERPIDGGLDESAYPPIATVSLHCRKLRSGPMSDIRSSLDHLIGGVQEFVRDAEAERLGGLEVDRELERRGLLDRQLGWIGAV